MSFSFYYIKSTSAWQHTKYSASWLAKIKKHVWRYHHWPDSIFIDFLPPVYHKILFNKTDHITVCNQAFVWKRGYGWPWNDRDEKLVSMITEWFTCDLYHNKVNSSLTPVERLKATKHTTVKWTYCKSIIKYLQLNKVVCFPCSY